ncbi:hypothetical protein HY642_00425 [Candidatus Woesearchaeota archaeon]|nr:hypothetical protein [Candidatus Woesearchaeota archaeon]
MGLLTSIRFWATTLVAIAVFIAAVMIAFPKPLNSALLRLSPPTLECEADADCLLVAQDMKLCPQDECRCKEEPFAANKNWQPLCTPELLRSLPKNCLCVVDVPSKTACVDKKCATSLECNRACGIYTPLQIQLMSSQDRDRVLAMYKTCNCTLEEPVAAASTPEESIVQPVNVTAILENMSAPEPRETDRSVTREGNTTYETIVKDTNKSVTQLELRKTEG